LIGTYQAMRQAVRLLTDALMQWDQETAGMLKTGKTLGLGQMTLRDRPYAASFGFSALLFVAAILGSDVLARTSVGGDSLGKAVGEHAYYAAVQPIGTAMLLAPFLLFAWMSASLAKRKGFDRGLRVFLLGALLLGFMYFSGYQDSQSYMKQRM
jgi:hypothetical protein